MRVKINVEDMAAVQERAARVARGDADGPGAREAQVTGARVEGAVGPGEGSGVGVEPAASEPAAAGVASDAPAPPPPPVLGGGGAPSASGAGGSTRTRVLVDDGHLKVRVAVSDNRQRKLSSGGKGLVACVLVLCAAMLVGVLALASRDVLMGAGPVGLAPLPGAAGEEEPASGEDGADGEPAAEGPASP